MKHDINSNIAKKSNLTSRAKVRFKLTKYTTHPKFDRISICLFQFLLAPVAQRIKYWLADWA